MATLRSIDGSPHAVAFLRYIRMLVKVRRANPEDDLVTALVRAEEEGDQLSEDELVAMIFLLLVAGHETTVNLIGNGTLTLLENPDQICRLQDNPALIKWRIPHLKTAIPLPEKALQPRKLWVVLAACIAAIGLAAIGIWYLRSGSTAQIDSIAVLPFTNGGGDANIDYLSDGITESLIGSFAHVPELKVKSRNSVFHYKGKDIDAQKVGNELGVSGLVSGRLVQRGDRIEVSAELTDVRDNTEIWGQHYSGKSSELISLQQQIAGDIAERSRSKLSTSETQQVTKQGTQNPEAYELYLKGIGRFARRASEGSGN